MSEILKNDDATEMPVETPLTGADESIADVPAGEVTESMIDQQVRAEGADPDQQPEIDADGEGVKSDEAPEGEVPTVSEDRVENHTPVAMLDVSNTTQADTSFWGGFFGAPPAPRVK
jgi:hypothetical protein